MAKQKENPDSLKKLNELKIDSKVLDYVYKLQDEMGIELEKRSWWNSNIDNFINMRYGIRPTKVHPWPGCANYSIPLVDSVIARVKPMYVQLVDISPIVIFEPYGAEDIEPSKKREKLFDWRMKTKVDFFKDYVLGVDTMLEQGVVVFKTSWKYSTRKFTKNLDLGDLDQEILSVLYDPMVTDEMLKKIIEEEMKIDVSIEENEREIERVVREFREGKTSFEMEFVEAKDDNPTMTACSVRYDLNFPIDTIDLTNDARWIDYKFTMSVNDVKIAMNDDRYVKYDDDTIKTWVTSYDGNSSKKGRGNSGYEDKSDNMILLHETCLWYDINGDGIEEKCIATYPDNNARHILRFIELPYDHGQWPYVLVKREINDSGIFSSRGYPALLQDFQNAISTEVNQTIDNGTITNTPQVVYKSNSLTNIRNVRYVPGNGVEVKTQLSDYEVRSLGNSSQAFKMSMAQYMKAWADERTGNVASGLSQANNQPGAGQGGNKTAKEVELITQLQSQTTSLDAQVFQQQMKWVYYQIDSLYNQFGSEEEEIRITGSVSEKIGRYETQGRFNYIPNGNFDNTSPQLRTQKAWLFLKAFLNDPDVKQLELKKHWAEFMDMNFAQSIFYTDEEKKIQQMQMQQQMAQQIQMQEMMKQQAIQTQLGLRVANDNLDVRKAAMMAPVEGAKYKPG